MSRRSKSNGYDRQVSIINPDGDIVQVEYAQESIKNGLPTVGVRFEDGVVLAGNRSTDDLEVPVDKVFRVDERIGLAYSGYMADAKKLSDALTEIVQREHLEYGTTPDIGPVTEQLASHVQEHTQQGGLRPFACGLIIGGVDLEGPQLYTLGPSGAFREVRGFAQGRNENAFTEYLRNNYDMGMSEQDTVDLVVELFENCSPLDVSEASVDLATITEDGMNRYDEQDLQEYLSGDE